MSDLKKWAASKSGDSGMRKVVSAQSKANGNTNKKASYDHDCKLECGHSVEVESKWYPPETPPLRLKCKQCMVK